MQISQHLFLVGSDQFGLTSSSDPNVYLIDCGNERVLIDIGRAGSIEVLATNIMADGFRLDESTTVVLTHGDTGHSEACAVAKQRHRVQLAVPSGAEEFVSHGVSDRVKTLIEYGIYPSDYRFDTVPVDRVITDGDTVAIGNIELQAIRVRGHSNDSMCYLATIDGMRVLFTGDTLFYGGLVGLVNLPGSSIEAYRNDIRRLDGLRIDSLFPAHGMFVLRSGQKHLDAAVEAFRREHLPPNQVL